MRIVVVGGGEIGYELTRELPVDHIVTVVDSNSDVGRRFESLDVAFIAGNGTNPDVLARASVHGSDLLIACTGLDEVNMVACALATRVGARQAICFVSRENFHGNGSNAQAVRSHFGIERIIWPCS